MTRQSIVTLIAGRFGAPLTSADHGETPPTGASLSAAGTEISWDAPDGYARRDRTVRVWMAIWSNLADATAYVAGRMQHLPILKTADETAAIIGAPFACHGNLNWTADGEASALYPHLSKRPAGAPPILVMTSLGIGDPEKGMIAFGKGVKAVREGFAENLSVLMDVNMLPDNPGMDGPTVTLWASEKDLMAGAYRNDPHKSAMKLNNAAMARASFARMVVLSTEGVWNGRDLSRVVG